MDCMIPGTTGLEVARRWRALEEENRLPCLPTVALNASAGASNLEETRAAGMDDVITKLCTLDRLSEVVSRWQPSKARVSLR